MVEGGRKRRRRKRTKREGGKRRRDSFKDGDDGRLGGSGALGEMGSGREEVQFLKSLEMET